MKNLAKHLLILSCSLQFACQSQPTTIENKQKDTTSAEEAPVDKLYNPHLSVIADDYTLKDSASFYELVNYIIENAEMNTGEPHELTDGSVSFRVYQMVYETPDDEISLNRKLDLISLMLFYHYHAVNEYSAKISGEITRANEKVISRPILLVPVLNATYWSEPVLYTIIRQETLVLPEAYVPALNKTLAEINELLNFRKASKKRFNGPMKHVFDKHFFSRYPRNNDNR